MFSLLLKDVLIQRKNLYWILIYLLIFSLAFNSLQEGLFAAIMVAITYQLIGNACAIDEKNKSDVMLNSLPVKKSVIVLSKYISVLIYAIAGTILYSILALITNTITLPINVAYLNLQNFLAGILALVLMNSVFLPIYFKMGFTKGRIVSMILFFTFFFGSLTLGSFLSDMNLQWFNSIIVTISAWSSFQFTIVIISISLLIYLISYLLSVKFYRSKEL